MCETLCKVNQVSRIPSDGAPEGETCNLQVSPVAKFPGSKPKLGETVNNNNNTSEFLEKPTAILISAYQLSVSQSALFC